MAVRQYIGARYTIKIYENSLDPLSAEWQSGVAYEPFTLVTYNNSSYLSRKQVSAGVGNPAANPSFWAITGAYNGQIASLQNQIDNINNVVIPAIQSDITNLQTPHKIAFIGDSYGYNYNFMAEVANNLQLTLVSQCVSGMGYCRPVSSETFIDLVPEVYNSDYTYDYVVCYGGINDIGYPQADIKNAVLDFIDEIRSYFTNQVQIIIVGPQSPIPYLAQCYKTLGQTIDAIGAACAERGVAYVDPSRWLIYTHNKYNVNYNVDQIHPSSAGYKVIVQNFMSIFAGLKINNVSRDFTITAQNANISNVTSYVSVEDGGIRLYGTFDAATVTQDSWCFTIQFDELLSSYTNFAPYISSSFYKIDGGVPKGYLGSGILSGTADAKYCRFWALDNYTGTIGYDLFIPFNLHKTST